MNSKLKISQKMIKKIFKKLLNKHSSPPKINDEFVYLVLENILEDSFEFNLKLGSYKFFKYEITGTGLGIIFKNGSKSHVLYLYEKLLHVYNGECALCCKWICENVEINLSKNCQEVFRKILKKVP